MVVTIALLKNREKSCGWSQQIHVNHLISISTKCFRLSDDYFHPKWRFSDMLLQVKGPNRTSRSVISHIACWIIKRHDICMNQLVMTCQCFLNDNRCWHKNVPSSQIVPFIKSSEDLGNSSVLQKAVTVRSSWLHLTLRRIYFPVWFLGESILFSPSKVTWCIFTQENVSEMTIQEYRWELSQVLYQVLDQLHVIVLLVGIQAETEKLWFLSLAIRFQKPQVNIGLVPLTWKLIFSSCWGSSENSRLTVSL